ncbi:NADPH-dependent assimilatory sulfite reductase hemoprotein subunit [Horticoccus luteus]|uniref:assimilatory sulfite reductase (NADPH) n=1 Tax=Horticoccus luteus TaxID=2862869 RepID=A0A8F9TTW2_9BACT|nr:NADPH-dependent assimilatory sulfite reductase hemoprotein subunit [Horticoccus luteus]QYM78035.1 NADPH-dependent assimilatory sulfite reductase hemoprotein subunit [Horticoccus luteus]
MLPNDPTKLSKNEHQKRSDPTLGGTISRVLNDPTAEFFADDDVQFLKFHGVYQQDDRDLRKTGKKYMMMVRSRIPGGVMTSAQWLTFDRLSTEHGNNTLRVTTRQCIQFHGVLKPGLRSVINGIVQSLLSTRAACGDVSRNVTASPTPAVTKARAQVYADALRTAYALAPRTAAYDSIWIDNEQLNLEDPAHKGFVDPLYGDAYLPRKFKASFVIPPVNDMDVFTNDIGFIAIVEGDRLLGYNVAVGGGMGRSHGNAETYPRLADVIGFVESANIIPVAQAVLTIFRDYGDRMNRKHARFKYVVEEMGSDWVRDEVVRRTGIAIPPARPYEFTSTGDVYGWNRAVDGSLFLTLFVETGRIKDVDGHRMKTALREVAEQFPHFEFRLSANQNVILANIPDADRPRLDALLASHGVKTERQASLLHASAMACPALPTCGLALAESERMLPGLIDKIEAITAELGLADEEIIIRSTGCPNGCARPYTAELAFVGKAPGRYQIWLGANAAGSRLNRLYRDAVKEPDIENELRAVFTRWRDERLPGERLGDFVARVIWAEQAAAQAAAAAATPPPAPVAAAVA